MQFLNKFESKSSRVKGLAFHPKQPWLLASLYNGTIQLWDYRIFVLVDRFEEHNGPVRSVSFHLTQPIFVSGGDDYKVNVWNHQTRKLLFTLNGHMDYVRTVSFHHEYPWILSASDDQTIRIWNWQSRQNIAILTGHSHYVMCAAFHPKEELIASASLDQTIRVWDISGLCKKYTTSSVLTIEDQIAITSNQQTQKNVFGSTDVAIKFVLEGHDRGINWVCWNPNQQMLASAGDDRVIKFWRYSETNAWEVDSARGHFNNVSCVLFHPSQELLLSVSEDKSLRAWDVSKRLGVMVSRRESDRYWIVVAHPSINLFAAGHDSGVTVFKLERERPAYSLSHDELYWVDLEKNINFLNLKSGTTPKIIASLKRNSNKWNSIYSITYNAAEKSLLAVSGNDKHSFDYVILPKDSNPESNEIRSGEGDDAVWIARNRLAILKKTTSSIEIRDLSNSLTRSIAVNDGIIGIDQARPDVIFLKNSNSVQLFSCQRKTILAELSISGIKYTCWSPDGNYVALISKQVISIATKDLKLICSSREPVRMKSAVWNENGVLIYTTLDHMRYLLLNGDTGIVKTLQSPLYLVQIRKSQVFGLDREAKMKIVKINQTEFVFKMALIKGDLKEILRIITTSDLVGQSIIAYLWKKGYPEIALNFVQDTMMRFELAIDCGKIDVALESAHKLETVEVWNRLASEASNQGNHKVMEICYQKLKDFNRLSFLYFLVGDEQKLAKMISIAEHRDDFVSVFQNSIFLGDVKARVNLLKQTGLDSLAYAVAKYNGLQEDADNILSESGKTDSDLKLQKDFGGAITTLKPIRKTYVANWPLKDIKETPFEKALLENHSSLQSRDFENKTENGSINQYKEDDEVTELVEDLEDGWNVDENLNLDEIADNNIISVEGDAALAQRETDFWTKNSALPAYHIAAGSFETAMQLLNKQLAVVAFEPLESRFMEIFEASRSFIPIAPLLPSLTIYNSQALDKFVVLKIKPLRSRKIESLYEIDLEEAYKLVKVNKLPEAITKFRDILYTSNIMALETECEIKRTVQLIDICTNYIVALRCEIERRNLDASDKKRGLELAAYFASFNLQPAHKCIALRSAMTLAVQAKNFSIASKFANDLINLQPSGQAADNARKIIATAERNPIDSLEIDYDAFTDIYVCAASFKPIYKNNNYVTSPFSNAKYLPDFKGEICRVDLISEIGGSATGRRLN